jgi:hypothetical protein
VAEPGEVLVTELQEQTDLEAVEAVVQLVQRPVLVVEVL